ncbi:MAG: class I SAM-dependent methyltransferase [Spirochaetaceae bacterium]|jgi:2-polyprenyl-3-methyl-5-hydroxy-6-metoxy-1,4-benzoquinol methylase|nr:class I SAM-dependent methyltransferase [Spirochaetaceae bacterium]
MKNILVVASFETGRGTGHLVRSARLVTELRARGFNALLGIVGDRNEREAAKVVPGFDFQHRTPLIEIDRVAWDLIVTDRYRTPSLEAPFYHRAAPVLGIDEGGTSRADFDFLLDILHCAKVPPNERRPDLVTNAAALSRREKSGSGADSVSSSGPASGLNRLNVLVSFGGEDTAGLGQKTFLALMGRGDMKLTVAAPANPIPDLAAHLADFDLVITHYGLTAYESLAAGVPVLLDHPGKIHRRLAKKAGFLPCGVQTLLRQPDGKAAHWVAKVLSPHNAALAAKLGLAAKQNQTLLDYIASLSPHVHRECPLCGGAKGRIIKRFSQRTYRVCPKCGIIYMDRLDEPPVEYAEDYFFDFYKGQYGRTYIEDFDNLKAMARARLGHIQLILAEAAGKADQETPLGKILDIGCAYGPFLQAAKEAGASMPVGFDPAESAVRYLKEHLGIFALCGFFPQDCRVGPAAFWEAEYFDVVTMWYVIEHFTDLREALETVRTLLKNGGVFAFSTPSAGGISGRKNRGAFLEKSPADHWTVWDPRLVKHQLAQAGFEVKKIVVTGHHPERFPRWTQFLGKNLLLKISKICKLGDTFEVYATSRGPPGAFLDNGVP